MKIEEVSGNDLNEWIAEKLEPRSALTSPTSKDWDTGRSGVWLISAGDAWMCRTDIRDDWHPRNFCADPSKTVWMIEQMPWPEITRFHGFPKDERGWMVMSNWDRPEDKRVAEQLGRAVAEAFAIWKGWSE